MILKQRMKKGSRRAYRNKKNVPYSLIVYFNRTWYIVIIQYSLLHGRRKIPLRIVSLAIALNGCKITILLENKEDFFSKSYINRVENHICRDINHTFRRFYTLVMSFTAGLSFICHFPDFREIGIY